MAFGGRGIEVHLDQAAIDRLLRSPDGPVARELERDGERITQEAKRLSPVSPHGSNGRPSGFLRSQIGWELGEDAEGLYVDIASPAKSPEGDPYGLFQEVGTSKMPAQPYLRPALDAIHRG